MPGSKGDHTSSEKGYFSAVLSSICDGIITTDLQGFVIHINPAAEALTGWHDGSAVGRPLNEVYRVVLDSSGEEAGNLFNQVLAEGKNVQPSNHRILISREGTTTPITDSGSRVLDDSGSIIGVVIITSDRTAERKIEGDLRERVKELSCLKRISTLVSRTDLTLSDLLERSAVILTESLLYADGVAVSITLDDSEYAAGDVSTCQHTISSSIAPEGKVRGSVKAGYTQDLPEHDHGPFLNEELQLLDSVAEILTHYVESAGLRETLRSERSILKAVFDGINDVIYVADPDSYELLFVNDTMRSTWGHDCIGEKCYSVLQKRDAPCPFCTNDRIMGENLGKAVEWEFRNEVNGKWYRCYDRAISWPDGRNVRFEIAMDITHQKQLIEDLARSEARYRAVLENIPQKIFVKDREHRWVSVNRLFARDLGGEPEDFIGRPDSEFFPEDLVKKYHADDDRIIARSETDEFDEEYVKDGQRRKVHTIKTPVKDDQGNNIGVLGVFWDVTEERERQEAVRVSEERYRTLTETANDMIYRMSIPDGVYEYVSPACEEIMGFRPQEFYENPVLIAQAIHPDWQEYFREQWGKLIHGEMEPTYEYQIIRKDGKVRWLSQRNSLLRSHDGEPVAIQGIVRDITGEREYTERLRELADNLARSNRELEQFAYVASHDLQEPLRMVSSYTQLLERRFEDDLDPKIQKYINYAVDGAMRMQTLINDLLMFSRITTRGKEFKHVDSHSILGQVLRDLSRTIEESNAIITNDDLPVVYADPSQLRMLLQNLVGNGIKFSGDRRPHVHVSARQEDGEWIFSVKDNGIGIAQRFEDKIFVIFQRLHSREEYSGTGIGLALCKRIMERHGGRIWFESEEGEGTTFFFTMSSEGDDSNV